MKKSLYFDIFFTLFFMFKIKRYKSIKIFVLSKNVVLYVYVNTILNIGSAINSRKIKMHG